MRAWWRARRRARRRGQALRELRGGHQSTQSRSLHQKPRESQKHAIISNMSFKHAGHAAKKWKEHFTVSIPSRPLSNQKLTFDLIDPSSAAGVYPKNSDTSCSVIVDFTCASRGAGGNSPKLRFSDGEALLHLSRMAPFWCGSSLCPLERPPCPKPQCSVSTMLCLPCCEENCGLKLLTLAAVQPNRSPRKRTADRSKSPGLPHCQQATWKSSGLVSAQSAANASPETANSAWHRLQMQM